ncbi:MAG: SIS domain-containing protein [Faecousia sp.]
MKENHLSVARIVLCKEIEALEYVRDHLDHSFANAVEIISMCTGKVAVLGIGKSGLVAKKISSTFSSLGTPSFFINSSEALHGDLGAICSNDIVLFISNSGEGVEIEECMNYVEALGCIVISISSNPTSTLALHSDVCITGSTIGEACFLGYAPTSSATAALVLGDALAVAVASHKEFSIGDFHSRHPGGHLGKTLSD